MSTSNRKIWLERIVEEKGRTNECRFFQVLLRSNKLDKITESDTSKTFSLKKIAYEPVPWTVRRVGVIYAKLVSSIPPLGRLSDRWLFVWLCHCSLLRNIHHSKVGAKSGDEVEKLASRRDFNGCVDGRCCYGTYRTVI